MNPMNDREFMSLDRDRLTTMPGGEVRATLIRVLDAFERTELANFDHLILFGIRLTGSGHNDLDLCAVEWASAKPSADRLDIVCTLLSGLWKHSMPGTRISAAALDGLIRTRELVQPGDEAEYQFLLVLSEVSAGKVFQPVVRGILERAMERRLSNAEMDRILKGVIRESLQG